MYILHAEYIKIKIGYNSYCTSSHSLFLLESIYMQYLWSPYHLLFSKHFTFFFSHGVSLPSNISLSQCEHKPSFFISFFNLYCVKLDFFINYHFNYSNKYQVMGFCMNYVVDVDDSQCCVNS